MRLDIYFERIKPDKSNGKMPKTSDIMDKEMITALITYRNLIFLTKRYSLRRITISSIHNYV
jgi:hypothetical protein